MKMSTIAIALTLTVASVQAMAQNVTLKPVDDNFETQTCYTAATLGYNAAKKFVRSNGLNFTEFKTAVTCNGLNIKEFAQLYADTPETEVPSTITIVAKDAEIASKACVEAIEIGEAEARAKYNLQGQKIFCNHREMSEFVRKYNADNVVVREIAED